MATERKQCELFDHGRLHRKEEALLIEEALALFLGPESFTVTMRTPGNDEELAAGLLFTEGILPQGAQWDKIRFLSSQAQDATRLVVQIPDSQSSAGIAPRSMMSVSSCGICGKQDLEALTIADNPALHRHGRFAPGQVADWFKDMEARQDKFILSGGAHAAAVFDAQGRMLVLMEDIGRHNAVDKAIGNLLLTDRLDRAFALVVSGRVSFEIVSKAAAAGCLVLAAVSAVSSLAAACAEKAGITLLGFCREGRFTCYSHSGRIQSLVEKK